MKRVNETVTYISGGSAGYFKSKIEALISLSFNSATVFLLFAGVGDERRPCVKKENQCDKPLNPFMMLRKRNGHLTK